MEEHLETERRARRRRRGKRRRSVVPLLLFLCLLILTSGGYGGYIYVKNYMPTRERAELQDYFDVAGDNVQVYLNEEKQRTGKDYLVVGRFLDGHVYLPYEFVLEKLNRRFYWQEKEGVFLYTLPEETKVVSESDMLSDGSQPYFPEGKKLYLNVDWVKEYTNIRYQQNTEGEYKRIFLYNDWNSYAAAGVKGKEAVRLLGGVKSPVLTDLAEGDEVKILDRMEKWTKVLTKDGFQGYLRTKKLTDISEIQPESDFTPPDYRSLSLPDGKKPVLGFHQIMGAAANGNLGELTANVKSMNVIAPTWYKLSSDEGDFVSYASPEYTSLAHEKGYQVWATLNNFDLGNIDESVMLKSMGLRQQLIAGLIQNALENDVDGLNVDIETLSESLGPDYVQFMRELSVSCRTAGLVLSADCYVPFHYNSHYDLEELGVFCDYVIIMCYDEHYAGSEEAGSVASISYVDRGIQEGLKKIPAEKLVIAVPFYTRVWTDKPEGGVKSEALSAARAAEWVTEKNVSLSWQEDLGQNYGSITDADGRKQIWMEDTESMERKLSHIREAGAGGVAAWKLGQEIPGFWDILNLNK